MYEIITHSSAFDVLQDVSFSLYFLVAQEISIRRAKLLKLDAETVNLGHAESPANYLSL